MNRIEAMQQIINHFPEAPVIANCGATSRELASLGRSSRHLYILDSMGVASSVGLGLAMAVAETMIDRVIVLEGDGALLMNLGSLASIGFHRPAPLLLVILDNESYASTGGQTTYAAEVDLGAMAEAAEIKTLQVDEPAGLTTALHQCSQLEGPICLHVKIEPGNSPNIELLLEDPAVIGHDFATWIKEQL